MIAAAAALASLLPEVPLLAGVLLAALALLALAGLGWSRARARAGRGSAPLLALGLLLALLALPELALRAAGFRHVAGVRFGYPDPELLWTLAPDAELFWTLPRDQPGVNALGFLGPDPRVPKPEGVLRVLFLGDSCTQLGHPQAYPELAEPLLQQALDDPRLDLEVVNLGFSGYSSHQGLALARRHGPRLEPDLVFVYYGWNDHWQAYGEPDARKRVDPARERLYRASRTLQALRKLAAPPPGAGAPLRELRVPLEDYRANLAALCELFTSRGVPVVLITAPSAHPVLGVPDFLLELGFARSKERVLRLHAEYNEAVRGLARERGLALLDLEAFFLNFEGLERAFTDDGIHFTPYGRSVVAERIADFARDQGLLRPRSDG